MDEDETHTIVVKIGGRAVEDEASLHRFLEELSGFRRLGGNGVLVHGGGAEVSRISRLLGIEPVFRDGLRITRPEEIPILEMVLAGRMNKSLVRAAHAAGIRAVGLSGADGPILVGEALSPETRTGRVVSTDPSLLSLLMAAGYFPILSSTTMDSSGEGLNINADEAALAVAEALKADALIFLSDIPGILSGGEVLSSLTPEEAEEAIARGIIQGGMIPKVRSSLRALGAGVGHIVIGQYTGEGDLRRLLEGKTGTTLHT
ncbi:acetylglutamate kinase [Spirochaeta thermophila DSM 6578]|uniref:Acetylglutamate kinase n=1 Tax=Winmispira thermophila (strain ATCC 700085 / DSM 6578 / Z-1203) TaxID=869211 RepID=G0GEH4_WINT7|nr:acetylglutamate kinase [Spirochaeta thermophila]AEJ62311.1 acetylglutamate kinase [Spirochaeta thermophila DSM 6578]